MLNKINIKYGSILFLSLTAYFLIMQTLGLGNRYDFRVFNAFIQIVVIYLAIRQFGKQYPKEFTFLSGTMTGIKTTVAGVLPFAIFQMVHLYLNRPFLELIREKAPVVGPYLNPFSGGLIIFMEGLAVGLVVSYICMRIVDLRITPARKPYDQKDGEYSNIHS